MRTFRTHLPPSVFTDDIDSHASRPTRERPRAPGRPSTTLASSCTMRSSSCWSRRRDTTQCSKTGVSPASVVATRASPSTNGKLCLEHSWYSFNLSHLRNVLTALAQMCRLFAYCGAASHTSRMLTPSRSTCSLGLFPSAFLVRVQAPSTSRCVCHLAHSRFSASAIFPHDVRRSAFCSSPAEVSSGFHALNTMWSPSGLR